MSKHTEQQKKVTVRTLARLKASGEPITMLTAYDYTMARLLDMAGVEMILVGDSAANVMAGHLTTLPITLEQMIYHGASVVRGVERAMVVVDMPFGSYQVSAQQAVASAMQIMKDTGADAVKLEGGAPVFDAIRKIVEAGVPVVGHLGLTPQSVNQFGGFTLQGATEAAAEKMLQEALELDRLGCCAIVVEKVPAQLGALIARSVSVPVIGIGAGSGTDGQVLVVNDMLGMDESFSPKFVRRFAHLGSEIQRAVGAYVDAVKERSFPAVEESY